MLILTRKISETLVINDEIFVTILDVNRKKIRIGIEAPKSIEVHRLEIFKKIQKEKELKDIFK